MLYGVAVRERPYDSIDLLVQESSCHINPITAYVPQESYTGVEVLWVKSLLLDKLSYSKLVLVMSHAAPFPAVRAGSLEP